MTTKENVLMLLEENRGAVLSGEEMAARLGVSRAAVWKAIQTLQSEGHQIEAGTNRGYTLCAASDVLTPQGILPYLAKKDVQVQAQTTVDSTNLVAKRMAAAGAPHGSLAAASCQTAGRGRRGRSFLSPAGTGLYLSVVLRSSVSMESAACITAAAAVAVCRALRSVCGDTDARIKWVNDVYQHGKKCCGILTEAAADMESGGVESIVVGIGLNLHTPPGGFPPELANVAGAFFADDVPVPRCRLAAAITNELLCLCDALPARPFMDEYRALNFVPGRDVLVLQNGTQHPAHAERITDDGHLVVRLPDGGAEELSFGEVSIRV